LYDTWEYSSLSGKTYHTVLTGLLTKTQTEEFSKNEVYGYNLDWVRDGDGIVNFGNS